MDKDVLIALIVAISTMAGPILLTIVNHRGRLTDRAEIASKLRAQDHASSITDQKIKEIHDLVSGTSTTADTLQYQLDANLRELALLREVARSRGRTEPEQEAEARMALVIAQQKIDDLRETLATRYSENGERPKYAE